MSRLCLSLILNSSFVFIFLDDDVARDKVFFLSSLSRLVFSLVFSVFCVHLFKSRRRICSFLLLFQSKLHYNSVVLRRRIVCTALCKRLLCDRNCMQNENCRDKKEEKKTKRRFSHARFLFLIYFKRQLNISVEPFTVLFQYVVTTLPSVRWQKEKVFFVRRSLAFFLFFLSSFFCERCDNVDDAVRCAFCWSSRCKHSQRHTSPHIDATAFCTLGFYRINCASYWRYATPHKKRRRREKKKREKIASGQF